MQGGRFSRIPLEIRRRGAFAAFVAFSHGPAVAGPWDCAQALRGNGISRFLTEARYALSNALQGTVDFEKLVVFGGEFGPKDIPVKLVLGDVCGIDASGLLRRNGLGRVLDVRANERLAKSQQSLIMPRPLRRDLLRSAGIGSGGFAFHRIRRGRFRAAD